MTYSKNIGEFETVIAKKNGQLRKERRRIYPKTQSKPPSPRPPPSQPNIYQELETLKYHNALLNDRLKTYALLLQEGDRAKQGLQNEINALQADYNILEDRRDELQDNLKAVKGKNKALKETSDHLREKNDYLRHKNNTLAEENEILKRKYRDMRYDRERAENDLQSLRDECYRRGWLWDNYLRRFRWR
ncbi:MAG: hypothetical protein LQ351_007063 [Letrouitia transgressa]|nr:MAG: hypothetical protein LQ351_007063 [Letrouitia transgressa]